MDCEHSRRGAGTLTRTQKRILMVRMSDEPAPKRECDQEQRPGLTRRDLVTAAAGVVLTGCAGSAAKWETNPVVADDGVVELDVGDYPELATPGGMIALRTTGASKPILVMRIENNSFRVMSLRCPHLGCVVRWDNAIQKLRCPCHGSEFDDSGKRLKGPAKSGLQQLRMEFLGMRDGSGSTLLRFKLPK